MYCILEYNNNLGTSASGDLYHANSIAAGDNNTAYDGLGQLTAFARGTLSASGKNGTVPDTITTPSRTQSWNLDTLGNWSSLSTNATTTNRTFNAQNQTATVSGSTAPNYDSNGNTTSDAGQTFVFDAWNKLVAVKSAGTTVAAYAYDALSRRVTESYGATTNHLYYSSAWQVIEERQNGTAVSNLTYQYVWGLGGVNQLVLRDGFSSGAFSQRLYAHWDTLGNITSLISSAGVVQERYLYDPYGSVTVSDASYVARPANASSYAWRYLFQGNRIDTTTGWYAVRNRDYIPAEGRWAERDPLSYAAGDMNLYRFVGNGPTYAVDISGLQSNGNDHPTNVGVLQAGSAAWQAGYDRYYGQGGINQQNNDAQRRQYQQSLDERNKAREETLDWIQTTLDVFGVFDPTGLADATNAAVSLYRGNYVDAAINAASILPGGDSAKALKLRKPAKEAMKEAAEQGAKRLNDVAPNSGGRGLIGLVKPGGTIDDALKAHYLDIARSPQMAAAVERYNKIARFLGQKPSASIDEIVSALGKDVTFSRVGHIRSGVFTPGQHPGATSFWIQGNPLTAYGRRAGRHELTHLGAALRGQGDNFLHEIAVQAATTPENLVIGVGSLVVIGGTVYWVSSQ